MKNTPEQNGNHERQGYPGYYAGVPDYPNYPEAVPAARWPRFLAFLRRLWWVPVATLAVACWGAAAYHLWGPTAYRSNAKLWVQGQLKNPQGGGMYSEEMQWFFGTQIELLESDELAERTEQIVLASNPNLLTNGLAVMTNAPASPAVSQVLPTNSAPAAPPMDQSAQVNAPLLQTNLSGPKVRFFSLKAKQLPRSAVFELTATGKDPALTQTYLDTLIDQYFTYKKQVRSGTSDDAVASLSAQITEQEKMLQAEQSKFYAFQRENNMAILEERGAYAQAFLSKLNGQLSDFKLEYQLLDSAVLDSFIGASTNQMSALPDPRKLTDSDVPSASPSAEFANARQQLQLLKIQRDELSQFLRPKHPKMLKLEDDIARGEKVIDHFRSMSRDDIDNTRQALKVKIDALQLTIKEWEGKLMDANQHMEESDRLKLSMQHQQTLYERLLTLLDTVDVNKNLERETVNVMQRASVALPTKPSPVILFALAVFAGFGGGLALVFLIARLDDRFTSITEVYEQFDEEIVGQVPDMSKGRGKSTTPLDLVQRHDKRHMYAESYRHIRSSLLYMAGDVNGARPKMLLVTSSVPSEGKSTIAGNLACTMAFAGARVLLVDADLRKGRQHENFNIPREAGQGGLGKMLREDGRMKDYLVSTPLPNLFVIPAGVPLNDSSELFLTSTFEQLKKDAREQFDYVIFDSAPVFAADDATTMAPKLDGVLFVIRSGFSRTRMVRQALEQLYQRQSKVLGLVFNRANTKAKSYYYYKYSDYYHSDHKSGKSSHRERKSERGMPEVLDENRRSE